MQTLSGRQLGGFSIGERLALGGMAAIYRATQISTEREVAVKVLPLHLAADPKLIARFEREARVLAALQHPHILPLIDFGREGDWLYLVTPLITQGDLAERLARWGEPLPLDEVGRIMRQLTDALDTAHRAGIVHRDLKPANVLLDARGNCLLSDFGIAKLEGAMGLTAAGTTLGTPEYMAPEQGAGKPVDARCDIYALGVILYELCTHRVPFEAESPTALLLKHLTEPPPPPRRFNAKLPPELEHVILRALAKEPAARYPSAEAMGRAIAHAIPAGSEGATSTRETVVMRTVESTPTVVQPRIEPVPAQPARRRGGGASWAAAGMLGALLAAAAWWQLRERPIAPQASPPPAAAPAAAESPTDATPPPAAPVRESPARATAPAAEPPTPATAPAAESPAPAAAAAAESSAPIASTGAYDDFDDAPFDGSFDPARWAASAGSTDTRAVQNGGVLRIETRAQFQGVYALLAPPPGRAPAGVQARVRLTGQSVAKQSSVGVTLSAYATGETKPRWWVSCYLYATAGAQQATPICTELGSTSYPSAAPSGFTRWHTLQFAFQDGGRSVALSSDGADVATMAVPAAASGAGTRWFVSLIGWSEDGKPVAGEFDAVQID